jgi:hypothetical protein
MITTHYDNKITNAIMRKGKVYVYSHGDYDGIATAALFIKAFVPPGIEVRVTDKNYDIREKWSAWPFDTSYFNVVLDYPCASDIDLWVDHHETGNAEGVKLPPFYSYDGTALSAVAALLKLINTYHPAFLEDNKQVLGPYMYWARLIDAAQYDNIDQVMKTKDNPILFDLCYKLLKEPYEFFVESLVRADLDFDQVMVNNPLFLSGGKKAVSEGWKTFFYVKNHGECTDDGVIFVDLVDSGVAFSIGRYAPFKVFESQSPRYMVTAYNLKKEFGISMSQNPFLKNHAGEVDLSALASKFGGGGHKGAAGISCRSKEEVFETMQKVGEEIQSLLVNRAEEEE